jgi:hypothetical protein
MNIEQIRNLWDDTVNGASGSVPDSVEMVAWSAGDNAADTCNENGDAKHQDGFGKFGFTDAFMSNWLGSVRDLLSSSENKDAREWFSSRGVDY